MVAMSKALFNSKRKALFKSKKAMGLLALAVGYIMMVDINMQQRSRVLRDHADVFRDLITIDQGGGECDIGDPTQDGNPTDDDATKTLLVSYPGSGKRFTWTIIKALTNAEVADDWNFSQKLYESPLTIKTSWPHKEGVWSWGKQMDQVLLLIRNPRKAIPSYHNMRWELDYADDWASSYLRIPNTYQDRPGLAAWESWRDEHFDSEMEIWSEIIDFWMQGGWVEKEQRINSRCNTSEIECKPKAVVDFDHFYQSSMTNEFRKISTVLESSTNVEVIAAQARVCVIDSVFGRSDLHQGGRTHPDRPALYGFTFFQFDKMMNHTMSLRNAFSTLPLVDELTAPELTRILDLYNIDNKAERATVAETFLAEWAAIYFNADSCSDLKGTDQTICDYISRLENHDTMDDDYYPLEYPYDQWLHERTSLMRLYYNNDGNIWYDQIYWNTSTDHCTWWGITCNEDHSVTSIVMPNNEMRTASEFPIELVQFPALDELDLSGNRIQGLIPGELCDMGLTTLIADSNNCHSGCCTQVVPK
eukprot:CAMPEP_0194079904 /NCGR_PEP_ID=MMETSP0149-20130528/6024_1 /TAXON_ID=122233 /ORGANISM="Chaetoceros debilis, Strain MM31A-1" /LENGTH=531 /DNA_ID=CAMNT_0038761499 /DNA_START=253 /DNA_END=1848 /DNA_ORIENTATION=+